MNLIEKDTYVLGIESSCDDTSVAVIKNGRVLSNITAGQEIHKIYGGVVPELASRDHQKNIIPVLDHALKTTGISIEKLSAVAFTKGPGLIGALLVGSSLAKSISLALGIPLIEVNHMQAHILANFIKDDFNKKEPEFPFLCLTISGGHTQLVLVKSHYDFELLGETVDDAVGEAFDKAAKIMGLPYPGGPHIDKFAKSGNPHKWKFPFPKTEGLNFSFSGIKTSFLYLIKAEVEKNPDFVKENMSDLCASLQHHLVSILIQKLTQAIEHTGVTEVAIAGGVSANSQIRSAITTLGKELNIKIHIPDFSYCTDNAAMIAMAGYYQFLKGNFAELSSVPLARFPV